MEILLFITSAVIAIFAFASFVLAFFTYRMNSTIQELHKSLTAPKLIIYSDLIDEDDREPAYTVVIRNVGQYPALRVQAQINIEEWRDGHKVTSSWDKYDSFSDVLEVLEPQEKTEYELPAAVESYIVSVKATASNCAAATARWAVGSDPGAFREVVGEQSLGEVRFTLGANSMKDLGKSDNDL